MRDSIFVYVYSASILPYRFLVYDLISHIRFRKLHPEKVEGHPFKMPRTVASAITILFLLVVLVGMLFNKRNCCFCSDWYFSCGNGIYTTSFADIIKNDGFRKVK